MHPNTAKKGQELIQAIRLSDNIIANSTIIDPISQKAYLDHSQQLLTLLKDLIKQKQLQAAHITSYAPSFLIYWNESVNEDTEHFWEELHKRGILWKRKEPLHFALSKGWFRNVHQAMEVRKHWAKLKNRISIQQRFTSQEISRIDEILATEDAKRHQILLKCLQKNKISSRQYLKFGDSIAYFNTCDLFPLYFTTTQVKALYHLWKNG